MPLGWFDRSTFVGPYRSCAAHQLPFAEAGSSCMTREVRMIIKLRQIIAKGINITSNWLSKALSEFKRLERIKTEKTRPTPQPEDSQVSQARLTGWSGVL